MVNSVSFFAALFLVTFFLSESQSFQLGALSYDESGYIEYYSGTIPIVLTAPHGGWLEPTDIPDRSCFGCTYTKDAATEIVAKMLSEALYNRTGCHAHLVINSLHRKKLDANRDIGDAACGNTVAESAWLGFHTLIDSAKLSFNLTTPGFLVDVHGQSHLIPRIELGYLLTTNDLSKSDEDLNEEVDTTSVRSLATNSPPLSSLIRGPNAFGTLLENAGIAAIPSEQQPSVGLLEGFFSGGYNTDRHGSRYGGVVDAFQMEMGYALRTEEDQRNSFAPIFADVVVNYFNHWYSLDEEQLKMFCRETEEDNDNNNDDDATDDDDNNRENGNTEISAGGVVGIVLGTSFLFLCLFCIVVMFVIVMVVVKRKRKDGNSQDVELQKENFS